MLYTAACASTLYSLYSLSIQHDSKCFIALTAAGARKPKKLRKSSCQHTTPRMVLSA